MLALWRKVNQSIDIGNGIKVMVTELLTHPGSGARSVRIGVDAPESVPVHRMEIQKRIERERQS